MRIDYFKMENLFDSFKRKPVCIKVIGTIPIPHYINDFDWEHTNDEIAFGERHDEDSWFRLDKEEIQQILNEYDLFCSEDHVKFECKFDIFRTDIEIIHDCSAKREKRKTCLHNKSI